MANLLIIVSDCQKINESFTTSELLLKLNNGSKALILNSDEYFLNLTNFPEILYEDIKNSQFKIGLNLYDEIGLLIDLKDSINNNEIQLKEELRKMLYKFRNIGRKKVKFIQLISKASDNYNDFSEFMKELVVLKTDSIEYEKAHNFYYSLWQ